MGGISALDVISTVGAAKDIATTSNSFGEMASRAYTGAKDAAKDRVYSMVKQGLSNPKRIKPTLIDNNNMSEGMTEDKPNMQNSDPLNIQSQVFSAAQDGLSEAKPSGSDDFYYMMQRAKRGQ